jgi:hypothetical protein
MGLRKIFGRTKYEVEGVWRKLHNEELRNLYSSSGTISMIKSRRMKWAGHVERMKEKRTDCRSQVGRPEEKRPLERPRSRGG